MSSSRSLLYGLHPPSLSVEYGNIENFARQQERAFVGTAGSVLQRSNKDGFRYYTHQFYDGEGKKRQTYLAGPVGSDEAEAVADAMRTRIAETKSLVPILRMLGREGFSLVDAKTYATLASLHNHGVFAAGAMLIGSHAYGVLLNTLGIRAAPYATDDIDIARLARLAFSPRPSLPLLEMLRESGVNFVEVPAFKRGEPPTSFKKKGRATFQVDLLVPSRDDSYPVVAVPELGAHATGLPHLKYLLAESQAATLLAREGCCTVLVPLAERFAVHKLVVAQLRSGRAAKSTKDATQSAVLCAALAELHPGAIEDAVRALPKKMASQLRGGLRRVQPMLEKAAPRAWAELTLG